MKAVELINVSMKFNEHYILENINLSVDYNDFVAIIGPNGGGKSTLLKIILGLLKPVEGEVKVFGKKPEEVKELIGYLPQKLSFDYDFPINVRETVLTGSYHGLFKGYTENDENAVIQALKDVEMIDFMDNKINELSGGQIQRVFIARAIVRRPKLLIMDEPTASIDPGMQNSFYKLMSKLKNEMAILLVSHDIGAVSSNVDKIACLNRELYYHGPVENAGDGLEKLYHCPIDYISHGIPHRVLKDH